MRLGVLNVSRLRDDVKQEATSKPAVQESHPAKVIRHNP